MIEGDVGSRLDLILGGGRANFLPTTSRDPEYAAAKGKRTDRKDLTKAWQRHIRGRGWSLAESWRARRRG